MEPVTAVETGGTILSWITDYGMLKICSLGFLILVGASIVLAWRYAKALTLQADAAEVTHNDHKEIKTALADNKEGMKELCHQTELLRVEIQNPRAGAQ